MNIDNVIRFQSVVEFQSRPAWRDGLDHSEHKLLRIIGDYSFSRQEALPCGLKGCRTPHQNGYVVETVDGLETHIGNRCGQRYFNVNWGELKSIFRKNEEDRDRQKWLDGVLAEKEDLLLRAKSALEEVAVTSAAVDDITKKISKEPEIKSAFLTAGRTGGAIQVERRVDSEIADAMNLSKRQQTSLETIGRIEGIEVAIAQPSTTRSTGDQILADIKILVLQPLNTLSLSSLRNLNARQRKDRAKEIELAKERLKNAEKYLYSAKRFLAPDNLRQIARLSVRRHNQRTERILKYFGGMAD